VSGTWGRSSPAPLAGNATPTARTAGWERGFRIDVTEGSRCQECGSDRRWWFEARAGVRRRWRLSHWGAQPAPGALYVGNSGKCAVSIREKCVFKFRVSSDGHILRFVNKGEAISLWQCHGGGGRRSSGRASTTTGSPGAEPRQRDVLRRQRHGISPAADHRQLHRVRQDSSAEVLLTQPALPHAATGTEQTVIM
jgi:hypothetical protein